MILKSSKIYVAGHNGMVGSAICRKLTSLGYHNLILKSSKELDLRNQMKTQDFFNKEFDHILLNGSFDDSYGSGTVSNWKKYENKKGKLIRVIGKYNIS